MQKQFWRLPGLLAVVVVLILMQAPIPASSAEPDTLTILHENDIPPRDPVDLARRLLGLTVLPATPSAPKTYQIGDQEQFMVIDNDKDDEFTVTATLLYATPHVYMWFEEGFTPDDTTMKRSADRFEEHIYPAVRSYFGSEEMPGIDNDEHLYILHAHRLGSGIAGYFDARSQYPKAAVPVSNEHQMFFMNLDGYSVGTRDYESTLAHEFQHMIHVNRDRNEQGWMDEGLAELAAGLSGYTDLNFIHSFMSNPATQLNTWSPDGGNAAHYGASYAFNAYFLQRFGEDALKKLVEDQDSGFEGYRNTLSAIGQPTTLEDLFADWVLVNLLDSESNADSRFHYDLFTDPFPAPTTITPVYGTAQDITTSQFGTTYLLIDQPGTYQFTFEGQPTVKVLPTDPHSGKYAWWSTSVDRSDTRLTREFDLSSVKKATLNFALWYTIEKDWDYGYVMASGDGGKTWQALATQDNKKDTHNNPYGYGYTGFSGSDNRQQTAWIEQSADLTPYVGKKVLIRFEYLTDDSTIERGMLVDDISIPEIGYSYDAEKGDDGWKGEGWVRMDNVLSQRYLVQMVEYEAQPIITRLLSPDDGISGKWDVVVGIDVSKVIIAVSGMTEFTIEPAAFRYTLTQTQQ